MSETLEEFAMKLQGMCYWWKKTLMRGGCKEMNGRYCCFCELSDELEALLERRAAVQERTGEKR